MPVGTFPCQFIEEKVNKIGSPLKKTGADAINLFFFVIGNSE
jgi:hypothetical protein